MSLSDQPIRISLIAPNGRMGQAIASAVAEDDPDAGRALLPPQGGPRIEENV